MPAAAALLSLGVAGSPAAAERVQAQLRVEATVLPACTVTTASSHRSDQPFACTYGERPTLAVGARSARPGPTAAVAQPGRSGDIKVITLTY